MWLRKLPRGAALAESLYPAGRGDLSIRSASRRTDISPAMTKRAQAFLDIANDESYDAVWFARGGYGSCRVAEAVMCRLTEPSRRKAYRLQ